MTDITLLEEVTVNLIRHSMDDNFVIQAAQVSVYGENDPNMTEAKRTGLINYLMSEGHGSPFEHTSITFYIEAPIFVFREIHRHRIASYNEMSGRYTTLPPRFYAPADDRKLVNEGKSARPNFVAGTTEQVELVRAELAKSHQTAWDAYQTLLAQGITNEVARIVLPVGIMSQMYMTVNARALMNFLQLRTGDERAAHPGHPMWEIQLVARKMEESFAALMPLTYAAFNASGRVAP